jgi:hypothetical protein
VRTHAQHPDNLAQLLERSRVLLSASCEALIEAESAVSEAGSLADELDLVLPRLGALVDRYDPPEQPAA